MRLSTLLALLLSLGCATTQLPPTSGFEETLRVYRFSKGKKALAVAVDENGKKAFAVLYGSWSQASANEKALVECTRNAEQRGVQATCYLFATGDEAAPSTLRGCAEGRIGARRCALQQQYPLDGD
jgi:hypothetical protein